tara:strand:+ start:104 stop:757 length:654 start_codon:yes stop_codon:yes gene_type:complete
MANKLFYESTGMYIDWDQLNNLPDIDTLVDIGVGIRGTENLYKKFPDKKLVLIDPLDEAENYAINNLQHRNFTFHKTALGNSKRQMELNIEKRINRSTFLNVTDINYEDDPLEKRMVNINLLDDVLNDMESLGRIGIKIDTEGYELDVVLGASKVLKHTRFVIAEVRHNHKSFDSCYKLFQFMEAMNKNNFQLSMILTAKPFIADLCFQPIKELEKI